MTRPRIALFLGVTVVIAMLSALSRQPVLAHGGGLDTYGCHNDNKAGNYHCHRGPCAGKTFTSKKAMLPAACSKGKDGR
jgi:hypothetical protein